MATSIPGARRATMLDLRRRNRASVLNELLRTGEGTRAQLADVCSLSTGTLTNVIADLIAEDLVVEAGQIPSAGGRPITRLVPHVHGAYALGADVGEHGITVDLFDLQLSVVDRVHTQIRPSDFGPETIRSVMGEAIAAICERNGAATTRLIGLGLGVPGLAERSDAGGVVLTTHGLTGSTTPLDELLPEAGIPLFAENGAKAMAIAERWRGAAQDSEYCVAALIGRGVGAGVVDSGELLRGATGSAGEWGHSKVAIGGRPCHCGARGCLEAYVSGSAIVQRWSELGGTVTGDDEHDVDVLLRRADAGDTIAGPLVADTVQILALGLSNLVNLVNPDLIVIGGWFGSRLAEGRLAEIDRATAQHSLRRAGAVARLAASRLGPDSVALGAALLVVQKLIDGDLQPPAARS